MATDFDEYIDRTGTSSTKFERYRNSDVLPLWVADMDFRSPPAVIDALLERVSHGVFGYTDTSDALHEAIIERLARLYDWRITAEDLVYLPGVVPALNLACRALAGPGEGVMTATPVYPPFLEAPGNSGRRLVTLQSREHDGRWQLALDELEAKAADASLLLLCNPYNPVGRALTAAELAAISEICEAHQVLICSDEIHCDLLFDGIRHIPMATVGKAARRTVTLMAPSKTFNLAGLGGSFAVIQNPELRERFLQEKHGLVPGVNLLGLTAMLAAYRHGDEWLRELLVYLQSNRDFLADALAAIPGIRMNAVEATYLAWLDVSALGLADPPAHFERAGLGMSEGFRFGDDRYMRLNFGCTRRVLETAVERLAGAARGN
ncbi:MAG: MalY/PatB family protein [Pseudomonadota bacterium]